MTDHDIPDKAGPYHIVESMAGTPLVMNDRAARPKVRIPCKTRGEAEEVCRRLNAGDPEIAIRPQGQVTLRRMMLAVSLIAVMLSAVRLVTALQYATLGNGWNTSVLPTGQRVMTSRDFRTKSVTLEANTRGVVTGDPTDDDSAYPGRLIYVKISEGQHRGTTQAIERQFLRAD
ncbi:hypothetical protein P12x_005712 [Tundrisphaera lichenicola]|uniref:hypothetical protein n=1 Tax=Tundrisphaera lichenicola TaxID=2029860 RepID=UPI003EB76198